MISKITPYIIVVVAVSILGFVTENIWIGMRFGYFDNRGMMLPGLLGYGMAMVGMFLILGTPGTPQFLWYKLSFEKRGYGVIYYVIMAAVLVSVGEIILGNLVERFCQIEWWNYLTLPLHIGKYTSVFTSLGFGLLITIFMDFIFPEIFKWSIAVNSVFVSIAVTGMLILLIVDFIYAAKYMIQNKKINRIWKVDMRDKYIENRGEVMTYGRRRES